MFTNKTLKLVVSSAAIVILLLVAISLVNGISLKNLAYGFFLIGVYGLLIAGFVSRFALVVLGVFAVYKVLLIRANPSSCTDEI